MRRKIAIFGILTLLTTGLVISQNDSNETVQTPEDLQQENLTVDTVIVATTSNYPDAFISSAPSDRYGIPVLLTEPGNLSAPTAQILEDEEVQNAVLVGGEAVVSSEVEQEISRLVNKTVRLSGNQASDTSAEVANYFWPDYSEATLVQAPITENYSEGYQLITAVSSLNDGGEPIMIADTGNLSAGFLTELEDQGVTWIDIYTTNESGIAEQLEQTGIQTNVNEGTLQELTGQLYTRIQSNEDNRTLIAIGGTNFTDGLPVNAYAQSTPYIIPEESLTDSLEFINESGFQRAILTGNENVTERLEDSLQNTTVSATPIPQGDSFETAAGFFEATADIWRQLQAELIQDFEEILQDSEDLADQETEDINSETQTSESVNRSQSSSITTGNSEISIRSSGNTVAASGSYTAETNGYVKNTETTQDGDELRFRFLLDREGDFANQVITTYDFEESLDVEPGNYSVTVSMVVDGDTVQSATRNINIAE